MLKRPVARRVDGFARGPARGAGTRIATIEFRPGDRAGDDFDREQRRRPSSDRSTCAAQTAHGCRCIASGDSADATPPHDHVVAATERLRSRHRRNAANARAEHRRNPGQLGERLIPRIGKRHAAPRPGRVDPVDQDDREAVPMQPMGDRAADLVASEHDCDRRVPWFRSTLHAGFSLQVVPTRMIAAPAFPDCDTGGPRSPAAQRKRHPAVSAALDDCARPQPGQQDAGRSLRNRVKSGPCRGSSGQSRGRLTPTRHGARGSSAHGRFRRALHLRLHLGTPGCQAEALLDFLRRTESDYLYLVGDIVDGWQLKRRWYWPQSHNDVVQKLLRKARKGTRVVYVPGNHDEAARHFVGVDFGGIAIVRRGGARHRRRAPPAGDARRPVRRRGAVREVAGAARRRAVHAHAQAQPARQRAARAARAAATGRCRSS